LSSKLLLFSTLAKELRIKKTIHARKIPKKALESEEKNLKVEKATARVRDPPSPIQYRMNLELLR